VQIEESQRKSEFTKAAYMNISQFNWQNFTDKNLARQLKLITNVGLSVLPVDEVIKVGGLVPRHFTTNTLFNCLTHLYHHDLMDS